VAVAANDWCTDTAGVLLRDRVLALLRAYHAERPLVLTELWFFSGFALYGALTSWLSRLAVARGADGQPRRCHNPAELERIVQQHSAHGFYLDPRLLDV
jgi:homoserine kinase type II